MAKRKSLTGAKKRPVSRPKADLAAEAATQPEVASHALEGLQRQFGNAEVARMLARRRGEDEEQVSTGPDADRSEERSTDHGHERQDDRVAFGSTSRAEAGPIAQLLSRTLASAKNPSPELLQRAITRQLQHGSISISAAAQLFDNGGKIVEGQPFNDQSQDVTFNKALQPGDTQTDHGAVRLDISATWDFDLTGPSFVSNKGSARLILDTPLRVPEKVKDDESPIKFKQPRLVRQESSGKGAALDPQPQAVAEPDEAGGSVTVSPRVTFQEQNATAAQVGATPFGLGVQVQTQNQSTDTQAFGTSFTAHVQVAKGATPKPDPQPDPNKKDASPKVLKRFAMATDFGVNKRVPSSDEVALLKLWWNGVAGLNPLPNQEARDAVRTGQTEVFVVGHASRTGSRDYNLVLSKDRADSVVQVLQADDVMGGGAKIDTSGSGLDSAKAAGEAQSERNATTIFEALVTDEPKVTASTSAPSPGPAPAASASNDVDS